MQSFDNSDNFKRPRRTGSSITVGRAEDLPAGRSATVELPGGAELALFNIGGQFYAIENFCPHRGAPLASGTLCEHTVECDWHGWRFDLSTGECVNRRSSAVEIYDVRIEDGMIKITV